jgi:hypothetical protein
LVIYVGKRIVRIPIATPNIPMILFVSLDFATRRSTPATIRSAPSPISARAVHPHGIGIVIPDASCAYDPFTSQTGAKVHGEIAITTPSKIRIIAGGEDFICCNLTIKLINLLILRSIVF